MALRATVKALFGLSLCGATAFVPPGRESRHILPRWTASSVSVGRSSRSVDNEVAKQDVRECTWSPQDLVRNNPGFPPIPDDDYVRRYQRDPRLWPVEFFVVAHRRRRDEATGRTETEVLVRRSANGTSRYGLGTGVPATRWAPSGLARPPKGYAFVEPAITFDACNYPEFPGGGIESWAYAKIDIQEDAFRGSMDFADPALERYASTIREDLRAHLAKVIQDGDGSGSWESSSNAVVKTILDNPKSVAAIQGSLRMSGLFAKKNSELDDRYVSFADAPDSTELADSARIYTMFPQMPDPMPLPTASAEELREEIATRPRRMDKCGRDPHGDAHGRIYTHISTPNVSNTIHGVYLTFDMTGLPGLDDVPALDLFGVTEIEREWVSLVDLKVLDEDGTTLSTVDTKPTFISGFIVRQLVKEGVISI